MKRLQIYMLLFFLAMIIPLSYLVVRTYTSLSQEEEAELRYFSEALFDRMEEDLARIVRREEGRPIDEYGISTKVAPGDEPGSVTTISPDEPFILGYFQNGPDGSFLAPSAGNMSPEILTRLEDINTAFNAKRTSRYERIDQDQLQAVEEKKVRQAKQVVQKKKEASVADRYFSSDRLRQQKSALGQEGRRYEQVTMDQAQNIARQRTADELNALADLEYGSDAAGMSEIAGAPAPAVGRSASPLGGLGSGSVAVPALEKKADRSRSFPGSPAPARETFQVEVAPLQSISVDNEHFFLFRRIVLNNEIYRQGFVIKIDDFLDYLTSASFEDQPLAQFTRIRLSVLDQGKEQAVREAGAASENPTFFQTRNFPRPFAFLQASLFSDRIPKTPGRMTLNLMIIILGVVILAGLLAIYQSARVVVDLSERRSGFVSSVTHELKTPLTNIRMYIEMLEQGIARDQEREQDYFRILGSESSRLSRLINNVLEFSKLERKQRPLNMRSGTCEEVIDEVRDLMKEKFRQEGFSFTVHNSITRPFTYDREVMIQILINLLENSMKFGRNAPEKAIALSLEQDENRTVMTVADTGPGIGSAAMKKVFDDFYREENSLTRKTEGTGIGLALVKRFVAAMGGTVAADNNQGPGCTLTITLPG
ncbi:sensor histidine kinase [Thermodesulfobacteriota bacterium]